MIRRVKLLETDADDRDRISKLFEHWVDKLDLQKEKFRFRIIKLEEYPGITLSYDSNTNRWIIAYDKRWKEFHLIHKLGYIWLWKKYGILDFMKKKPDKKVIGKIRDVYNLIMDSIIYSTLVNMDLDFKEKLLKYDIKGLLRTYKGRFPKNFPIFKKITFYIFHYLKYFNVFPEYTRKDFMSIILSFLANIETQIIEDSKKDKYPLTKQTFTKLHKVLWRFDSIKNSENYRDIIDYMLQICEVLPYWNREYLIEQFNHYICYHL